MKWIYFKLKINFNWNKIFLMLFIITYFAFFFREYLKNLYYYK